jgi:hypothetical protein
MFPLVDPNRGAKQFSFTRTRLLMLTLVCALGVAPSLHAGANLKRSESGMYDGASTTQSPSRSILQTSAAAQDKGDFKLVYKPVKDKELLHVEKLIKDSKLFERVVADSNKELSLPFDVTVEFRECKGKGEDPTNAFYDPNEHSITLCYGLIKKSEDLFRDDDTGEQELRESVLGSTAWTFYHEMGHALIDIYKIAHTGKEEDAADELSTYILINEGGDEGELAALNGAVDFFREASEDNDIGEEEFADSHSLSKQRFYNIICMVYGSNPEKYEFLTEGDKPALPTGRAEGCEDEYKRLTKAWQNLLGPFTKK